MLSCPLPHRPRDVGIEEAIPDLAQIDFGDYIQDLAGYLFRAQGGHTRNTDVGRGVHRLRGIRRRRIVCCVDPQVLRRSVIRTD